MASHASPPASLDTSQEYRPPASLSSVLRHSRMQELSVVVMLYLYEAKICWPSLYQLTVILGVPAYVHSSVNGFPFSTDTSFSFFEKAAGSERQTSEEEQRQKTVADSQALFVSD